MDLRPYQEKALNEIRAHYAAGTKKVLLHLATGGGKTLIFCNILKGVQQRGKKAMMVVRGKKLVDQASKRLDREGVDHGVIMADHWRNRPNLPIQVCSIDTIYARRETIELADYDLIVIDEAHFAASPSFIWLITRYENAFFLPVTATPHVKKGLRHIAEKVVYPITMKQLIDEKYLVAPEYYAPSKPNLDGVKVDKTGDYNLDQLSVAMERPALYGDMLKAYKEIANGLPALLFCVSVSHSKSICSTFNYEGVQTEHMDANTPEIERNKIMERFEKGETKVISNVGILTTGVDIPSVKCIILARPTKSYNLFIQILGRGTRPYPGKDKFIVLDHANAVLEHGFIECEMECDLDGKDTPKRQTLVTCSVCSHIWNPLEQEPPYICQGIVNDEVCGNDMTPIKGVGDEKERGLEIKPNYEMKKIEIQDSAVDTSILLHIEYLAFSVLSKNSAKPIGRIYHLLKQDKRYGPLIANKYYKRIEPIVKKIDKEIASGRYQERMEAMFKRKEN